ncbi:trihelix transcription factor ASIL2-like [Iris pallida]|uniref:Trihelix transcription factor ASIL2-like n=1 Tax=Iris pallida TaxID=29817 RepID=A0AAX6FEB3_IRIPA|nr:trihelix transcription factor ASIL2-like [Iris pallida]
MDDDDDDARYPPNPNPHRHKPPLRNYSPPQFPRAHRRSPPDSDDSEPNNVADEDDESDEEEANNHSASSPDSRGKRRKLDRFAQGFEFAPRKPPPSLPPPPTAGKASTKPNSSKNSPPDWSEDSTFVLLDAWGDLFVQNGRKSLRSDEWSEVAKKVNHASRIVRSDSQCRNRLDTLKKKYKKEKLRVTEYPDLKSEWIYFKKMDSLMCSPSPPSPAAAVAVEALPPRLPCGVDAGEYVFSNNRVYTNRANGMDEMRDSPGDTGSEGDDDDDDESDGLPPAVTPTPAVTKRRGENSASFRMLADSIRKFGEVYEKIEIGKRQQMAELERMRSEFQRDLEVKKRQILERAQAEIARMRQDEGEEEDGEEERTDDDDGADGGVGGGDDDIDGSAENMSS